MQPFLKSQRFFERANLLFQILCLPLLLQKLRKDRSGRFLQRGALAVQRIFQQPPADEKIVVGAERLL